MRDGVPVLLLWGRLEDGRPFCIEEHRFRPYFFVPTRDAVLLDAHDGVRHAASPLLGLDGEALLRVELDAPGELPRLRDRLIQQGGTPLEADLRFPARFLIDHEIRATCEIDGPETRRDGRLVFRDPELRPAPAEVPLTTLSIDLETTPDASAIFSVAIVGCGVEEVHLSSSRPVRGAIHHPDERTLLLATLDRIRSLDPDLLLGWAVVDFDVQVFQRRCEALHVPCRMGRGDDAPRIQRDIGFTRQSRADLSGRIVLDGIPLVRDALRLPDYRLETVGQHVLGRGKKIDHEAPSAAHEILRMYRHDPESLVAYNLEDARLVPEILEHEGLLALTIERSRLSGMPLDRVGASVASFDRLYLPELRRRGRVAPSVAPERKSEWLQGGALLDPVPGIHERVAVFDFKSLYPSLIRTFHLDPLAHALAGDDAITSPDGARFDRHEAILPTVLEGFIASRDAAKARGDRHADQAIKIMMNALYGVLGAASCRFFEPAIANAITGFGQRTLHWTRDAFQAEGLDVIYGDTDSVFVRLPPDADAAHAETLRARVEERISARIRDEDQVEPKLTLELEKIFDRFFLPRNRGSQTGSKKRYAGWMDGRLVVAGLESVRRDWPAIARHLQEGMLERLFQDAPVLPFVKECVDAVRAGERDADLVYTKRIRRRIDDYAAKAPHVLAARKAKERTGRDPGRVIHYAITTQGPEPVLPREPLPTGFDHRHYVEKVLRPVADAILVEMGHSFDEAIGEPSQMQLL